MTTNIRIKYESGNKSIEVVTGGPEGGARPVATLEKPGDEFVACVHSDSTFAFREVGDFRSLPAEEAAQLDGPACETPGCLLPHG